MEPTEPKAGRPASENSVGAKGPSIKLAAEVDILLSAAAKKLGVSKGQYASRAVSYFAENGLDPREPTKMTLAKVYGSVGQEATDVRAHNANIGNRLVAILRAFERNNGQYLQAQQGDLLVYLERIERNILSYLATIEEKVLASLLEQIIRVGAEARIARVLSEVLVLKFEEAKYSPEKLQQSMAGYDEQRERQTATVTAKVAAANQLAKPALSARPTVKEPPKPGPGAKPAVPAAPASAASTGATVAPTTPG